MRVNLHDAKVGLSAYVKRVQNGETIILCNRNVPVAELRPIYKNEVVGAKTERVLGFARGEFSIPDSFFESLTDDELSAW